MPAGDEPSDWCHPMVLIPKTKGVHITVDFTHLNNQVSRPSLTTINTICSITPSMKYFATADALHGYWQMDFVEEGCYLTTFIAPYGRFLHCQGPMGFTATGDAYCLLGNMALQGITN